MELNQLKSKLDELVRDINKFYYVKSIIYIINNLKDVDLNINIKSDPFIDSIEDIHNIINYYERYLQSNHDKDFEFNLTIRKP